MTEGDVEVVVAVAVGTGEVDGMVGAAGVFFEEESALDDDFTAFFDGDVVMETLVRVVGEVEGVGGVVRHLV